MKKTLRLLVIDDSVSFRGLLNLMLQGHAHLSVVGLAEDGERGMKLVVEQKPDVILLDLEMPRMDGFTFLRWLMANYPTPTLVLSGRADSDNVFKALELGACDFLSKLRMHEGWFKNSNELILKIEAAATIVSEKLVLRTVAPQKVQKREQGPKIVSGVLAIGASTGGPRALYEVIGRLPQNFPVPIVISQHMPKGFTHAFAETLNKKSFLPVMEVQGGEHLENGTVYLAPGGHHLLFEKRGGEVYTCLVEASNENIYVPSIDKMLCSSADIFGSNMLGILLTGMGHDGHIGFQQIKAKGGVTFAESEETAVIYGMPRVSIEAGVVDKALPLHKIADEVLKHYAKK
ncbi:MAG: chemotaxis-specific protein-glutamate methyltransferase CheB [Nitrospirae bacterium]|nr:chemotaxis-specific protein-glutamate methyltransferase CheB [Candidatus Troglogloeales bacterium]